jgi:hypothetical protein
VIVVVWDGAEVRALRVDAWGVQRLFMVISVCFASAYSLVSFTDVGTSGTSAPPLRF